jgi:hypothetical protein
MAVGLSLQEIAMMPNVNPAQPLQLIFSDPNAYPQAGGPYG